MLVPVLGAGGGGFAGGPRYPARFVPFPVLVLGLGSIAVGLFLATSGFGGAQHLLLLEVVETRRCGTATSRAAIVECWKSVLQQRG
jgi:hypothetical protein